MNQTSSFAAVIINIATGGHCLTRNINIVHNNLVAQLTNTVVFLKTMRCKIHITVVILIPSRNECVSELQLLLRIFFVNLLIRNLI